MGILLVYDVTDEKSFNSMCTFTCVSRVAQLRQRQAAVHPRSFRLTYLADIRTWFSNVEQHATEGVNKILIGNKCDWEEKRAVSTEQGQALADELGIPFMEVSAKTNVNVEKAFFSLASDIKKRIVDTQQPQTSTAGSSVPVGEKGTLPGGIGKNCC